MSGMARGVEELRVRDASGHYRLFCVRGAAEGILVLRAYMKKARQTPRSEFALVRRRLAEIRNETS